MAFTTKKPDRGPSPSADASNIQGNFDFWDTAFAVNHVAINESFQGDHTYVVFQKLSSNPKVSGNHNTLFAVNATSKVDTQPQLFFKMPKYYTKIENNAMQMTYNQVNVAGPQFQSFLPGGYLLYFGSESNINLSVTITLVPEPKEILLAIATPNNLSGSGPPFDVRTTILTNKTFKIDTDSTGSNTFGYVVVAQA